MVVLADPEADRSGWCTAATPAVRDRGNEVVVAVADVVVVVAEAK